MRDSETTTVRDSRPKLAARAELDLISLPRGVPKTRRRHVNRIMRCLKIWLEVAYQQTVSNQMSDYRPIPSWSNLLSTTSDHIFPPHLLQGRPDHVRGEHVHVPDRGRAGLRHPGLHGAPAGHDGARGGPLRPGPRLPHLPGARPQSSHLLLLGNHLLRHAPGEYFKHW